MLEFCNVSVSFGKRSVLKEASFAVGQGELTVLIGKNGSGKTTLFSAVNGEVAYTGQILLDGRDIRALSLRERAKRISLLPQVLRDPRVSVEELVAMGRTPYQTLGKRRSERDSKAIEAALCSMGLEQLRNCRVDRLSGGERQKAYLAMILAQQTPLLLLDEPTTYLDPAVSQAMLSTLTRLRDREQKTLLVVTHDLNAAVRYADWIVILEEGSVRFAGTREQCLECEAIEQAFSVRRFEVNGRIFFEGEE